MSVWPSEGWDGQRLLDPSGLEVRLARMDRLEDEASFPAGAWFSPPRGTYRYWIEGDGWMSPFAGSVSYSGSPFRGRGMVAVHPVVRAGRIALPGSFPLGPHLTFRLLHIESHNRGPSPRPEMSRRVTGKTANSGVWMPEGQVLAGLFDDRRRAFVGLSRPVIVRRGRTTFVHPQAPKAAGLVAVLDRPSQVESFDLYDVSPEAVGADGRSRYPDVVVPTTNRLYAVWYELAEAFVSLEVSSPSVELEPRIVRLGRGSIERVEAVLRERPSLEVLLRVPTPLESMRGELIVRGPSGDEMARKAVTAESSRVEFEGLASELVSVTLDLPPWRESVTADLRRGSESVELELRSISLTGQVYRGTRGHPARLVFAMKSDESHRVEVQSDEAGRYEVVLWSQPYLAALELEGFEQRPFFVPLAQDLVDGDELDFRLLDNSFVVRVVDLSTGEPIPESQVVIENLDSREYGSVHRYVTDSEGVARLQPLTAGRLRVAASAADYRPGQVESIVDATDREREILVRLEPLDDSRSLSVRLPTGAPAIQAKVCLMNDLLSDPTWCGHADGRGTTPVPAGGARLLVVTHPDSGFVISPWNPGSSSHTVVLPAEGPPLQVAVLRGGGEPAAWARMAMEVGGHRIAGGAMSWLAGASSADGRGWWIGRGLPMTSSVKLLAWLPRQDLSDLSPLVSNLGHSIAYPWPAKVEIRAIE